VNSPTSVGVDEANARLQGEWFSVIHLLRMTQQLSRTFSARWTARFGYFFREN
jgi:hypothetical protein